MGSSYCKTGPLYLKIKYNLRVLNFATLPFKTAITEEEALKLGANEVVSKLKISDNTFIETIERMLPDDSAEDPDVLYVEESMPE
tara:strand:- start:280 stop:534 length:255 start_codon:yes stop_codon:yes gene_type:complete